MQDVSFLVIQQGKMIDNIHENIITAKDYIKKAEVILD